jgi:hypothetical protein
MIDRRDVRAAHIVKAEDHSTRDVALAISDETCTGTKALCRISLSCPANKCMEDLNLDGVWGCVTCSTPGGSPTDKKENSSPPDGKKKKTR